jgi:hypothetical protein
MNRRGWVGAISPFNFLESTLYGRDAIATDEHGFSRMKRRVWVGVLAHAKPRREQRRGDG